MPRPRWRAFSLLRVGLAAIVWCLLTAPSPAESHDRDASGEVFMPRWADVKWPDGRPLASDVWRLPLVAASVDKDTVRVGKLTVARAQLLPIARAQEHYSALIERNPCDAWARTMRAVVFGSDGAEDRAMTDLDEAVRSSPNYAPAFDLRGRLLCRQGKHEVAYLDFDRALRIDPKRAQSWFGRGMACRLYGVVAPAIEDLSECIRLDPSIAMAYKWRAAAYCARWDYEKAIADCSSWVSLDPTNSDAYYWRSALLENEGDETRARVDYEIARRLQPSLPEWRPRAVQGSVFLITAPE